MHPVVILAPALALLFGPRLWVGHVLKKHNRIDEDVPENAGAFARVLLDRNGLQSVRVESTDIGDHYDPQGRVVRIGRDKFDRKTLTALTTASHEVAHAIQHATGYRPFVWRDRLVKIAQFTGDVGSVLLLAVPAAALMNRNPVPPATIGTAALAMLGTSGVAQLAALPSELDASFGRALPMLRDAGIQGARIKEARTILLACSLTYVASSMVAILHIWPWVARGPVVMPPAPASAHLTQPAPACGHTDNGRREQERPVAAVPAIVRERRNRSRLSRVIRRLGRPLVRSWLTATGCA